jgi:uncharacterized protein (TIRG00374 family)
MSQYLSGGMGVARGMPIMRLALRLVIVFAFIALLFHFGFDVHELGRDLRGFSPAYGWLAAVVILLDRLTMTYKWALLLRVQGYRLPVWSGMKIYCASMLWGTVLPTTVGADAVRALLAMKRGIGGADVTASIIVERMIGFLAALLLALFSLVLLRTSGVFDGRYYHALYVGAAVLIGGLALIAISLNATVFECMKNRLPRKLQTSTALRKLERLALAYRSLEAARGIITVFTLMTLVEQSFNVIISWVLARGFGIEVDMLTLLAVVPVATLISRIPISIDGLGVYETVFAALMVPAGVPASASVAISLAVRAIQFLVVLPWWIAQVLSSGRLRPPEPAPTSATSAPASFR